MLEEFEVEAVVVHDSGLPAEVRVGVTVDAVSRDPFSVHVVVGTLGGVGGEGCVIGTGVTACNTVGGADPELVQPASGA